MMTVGNFFQTTAIPAYNNRHDQKLYLRLA